MQAVIQTSCGAPEELLAKTCHSVRWYAAQNGNNKMANFSADAAGPTSHNARLHSLPRLDFSAWRCSRR